MCSKRVRQNLSRNTEEIHGNMRQDCQPPSRDMRFHISKNNNKKNLRLHFEDQSVRYTKLRPARVKIIKHIGENVPNAENCTYMRINAGGLHTQQQRKLATSDTDKHRVTF
jgi:hypothetical protein